MREVERGELGPEHDPAARAAEDETGAPEKRPAAPYHDATLPEGGLAPRAAAGEGATPPPSAGAIEATAGRQIGQERRDLENEAANGRRDDPSARGVDE